MPEIAVAIPGDLTTPTGGYVYARRLITALPAAGWQPRLLPLPNGFPFPNARALDETHAAFATLAPGNLVLVDGLAFGTLPVALLAAHRLRYVALVHHPLAAETGLAPALADALRQSERTALAQVAGAITTSAHTAERLIADYGVPASKIAVARPGTDRARRAKGSGGDVPVLLTIATLTPRKGHLSLVAALAALPGMPWRAQFVGSEMRDPACAAAIRAAVHAAGLQDRITFHGAVSADACAAFYDGADIFVLPSLYEGYGMVFAEALAHGLPIVGCAAGAVPEVVPRDAGLLVAPDAPAELADALARLIGAPALRALMSDAAWNAAATLPQWADTARAVAAALSNLAAR